MPGRRSYDILGLMSGSSLDGLDLAYCHFNLDQNGTLQDWTLGECATQPYSEEWIAVLAGLPAAGGYELLKADAALGRYFGELTAAFIRDHDLSPSFVASHGHTVLHDPANGFTFQAGDGAALAAVIGIPVIDNFRQMDVAHGGQGAPLAPLADHLLMREADFFLNLGGIANISARTEDRFVAFDVTGANQILNALVAPLGKAYDEGGQLARRGKLDRQLLKTASNLPFFRKDYPKSLGNKWVRDNQTAYFVKAEGSVSDKLHTAVVLIAEQIAAAVANILDREKFDKSSFRMLLSGGGAFNGFLVDTIRAKCQLVATMEVVSASPELVAFKEAALMALMGMLRLEKRSNCMASVTGAKKNAVGGVIHLP